MSILVNKKTRLVVQGLTGSEGTFHTSQMLQYGTNVVAGVTPGKGGTSYRGNDKDTFSIPVPVYNTVRDAVKEQAADTSIIFVPAAFAADAIMEAADAGIQLIVCITEGIPVKDMVTAYDYIQRKSVRLIGPNCPGIITPGECKIGIMPAFIHKPGRVGVISRSGTLTYESVWQLTERGIGQSTCIGIGGDPIIGTRFVDALALYNADEKTDGIIMIGEIGGTAEEEAAEYIRKNVKKPVVGFIAGRTAPAGRRMGHAGAIISGGKGTAAEKMEAMRDAGIHVCESPAELGDTMQAALGSTYRRRVVVRVAKAVTSKTVSAKPAPKKKPAKAKAKAKPTAKAKKAVKKPVKKIVKRVPAKKKKK
jgi:succinyl-CoA synthetase alpha subunit